jgi:hypothetical protein
MYTITLRYLERAHSFFKEGAPEVASTTVDGISESRQAEIMKAVEEALAKNEEQDPKHEALKFAVQSSLDPILNDPQKVLQMIEYAQEHWKSALTVLAISKRFATLIGDTWYFTELSNIEQNLIKDKNTILTQDHTWIDTIKESVRKRILWHLADHT